MEIEVKTDRRVLRSQQAIKRSFLELFSDKEFDRITINEIAERANVNRGTVYLHYADKYDLLDKCIEDHVDALISLCKNGVTNAARPVKLHEPLPVFDYFREHFRFFHAMFCNERVLLFRDRLLHFLSVNLMDKLDGTAEDSMHDKEIKAQFLASAFIGILEWWIRRQMPHSAAYMSEQVRQLFETNHVSPS